MPAHNGAAHSRCWKGLQAGVFVVGGKAVQYLRAAKRLNLPLTGPLINKSHVQVRI